MFNLNYNLENKNDFDERKDKLEQLMRNISINGMDAKAAFSVIADIISFNSYNNIIINWRLLWTFEPIKCDFTLLVVVTVWTHFSLAEQLGDI